MKIKSIKKKIEEYFFLHPTIKLRVRQIEREIRVPLHSAIRYAQELEKESILKKSTIADVMLYSASRTSATFLLEKKLFNIRNAYSSGLIDYLIEELSNPTIIVFGSYSRGEDVENSDIDIYIETPTRNKLKVEKFEKILQRKIQIFVYKNIHDVENKELANNIVNGVILNGFVEIFK